MIAFARLTVGLATLVAAAGCDNECDFFERCAGDVREVCGDGPDQTFHRRIHRQPCEDPNTICVERDEDHATCVLPAKARCDDAFERRCEGETLVSCSGEIGYSDPSNEPARYLVGLDCASEGRTCVDYGADASCVESK